MCAVHKPEPAAASLAAGADEVQKALFLFVNVSLGKLFSGCYL